MENFTRRRFLARGTVLAALYPIVRLIQGCQGYTNEKSLLETFKSGGKTLKKGLRHIHPNGAYFYFYFVNAKVRWGNVVPEVDEDNSYMVVQIPPQSLHEMSLMELPTGCQVPAALARSSFLTFQLWPRTTDTKKFPFSMPELLKWENGVRFRLLTTLDVPKERYRKFADVAATLTSSITLEDQQGEASFNGYEYYKLLLSKLFYEKEKSAEPFISVIEIPTGLILAPHIKDKNLTAKFIQNNYKVSSATYKIKINGKDGIRKVYERWYGQLTFVNDPMIQSVHVPGVIPPVLRAIGLRSFPREVLSDNTCDGGATQKPFFFPTLLQDQQVVYLNQLYNESEAYDIQSGRRTEDDQRLPSPFLLTSSGATVKFSYYNMTPTPGVDLVEYEHHFQNGQDIYIRVGEIGIITPSTEKGVHVKVSRRKIAEDGRSYMEYQEYMKTINEFAKYPKYAEQVELTTPTVEYKSLFTTVSDDTGDDPVAYKSYSNRTPFEEMNSLFKESPPIRPTPATEPFFWIYKQGANSDDYDNLLQLPFQFTDRSRKVLVADCPVFFMRKTFLETTGAASALFGSGDPAKSIFAKAEKDHRMRLFFNDEVITYTSTPSSIGVKQGLVDEANDEDKNKLHQVPTSFIEYYFDIAQSVAVDPDFFNNCKLVVGFQMRRAKGYFDHFQQISSDKVASLFKHNLDYLKHDFHKTENQAKLIFDHRKDFIRDQWQNFSNTVTAKTDALDDQFKAGYNRIRNIFTNAGASIGPFINPGLEPERIGLVKAALSLSENVNQEWKTTQRKVQRTAHMFKSSSADFLNGIPFRSILTGLIDIENSPQFLLKKISGEVASFDQLLQQIDSDVVRKVVKSIQEANDVLLDLKGKIAKAEQTIRLQQDTMNRYKNQILQSVPDYSTARSAVLQLFEIQALRFINDTEITSMNMRQHIFNDTVRQWKKFVPDLNGASFLDQVKQRITNTTKDIQELIIKKLKPLESSVPPNIQVILKRMVRTLSGEEIDPAKPDLGKPDDAIKNLTNFSPIVEKIFAQVSAPDEDKGLLSLEYFFNKAMPVYRRGDVYLINPLTVPNGAIQINWGDINWSKVAWALSVVEPVANWGIDQLRQLEIQFRAVPAVLAGQAAVFSNIQTAIIARAKAINTSLYSKAVVCSRDLMDDLTAVESYLDAGARDSLERINEILQLVIQSSPAWYYDKYKILQKDYADLYSRTKSFDGLVPDLAEFFNDPNHWIKDLVTNYQSRSNSLAIGVSALAADIGIRQTAFDASLQNFHNSLEANLESAVKNNPVSKKTAELLADATSIYDDTQGSLKEHLKDYESKLNEQGKELVQRLTNSFDDEVKQITDMNKVRESKAAFNKFLQLFNSVRRQELNYNWQTDQFQPASLGIIKFTPESSPKTILKVSVSAVAHLDPLHPGNVVERMELRTATSLVNFSVGFFSAITLGFSEVSFQAGTGVSSNTRVMIRDVKFEGALSFIQKLQEMLQSLGNGFSIEQLPNRIALSYFFDIPAISTPGFSFINFAIGVGINIYFDRRPMTVSFMLARPDRKAIVAAGIYGGGFFTNITADPKRGIQSIEMALEMGAYLGITIGPIHGEVKMMVGLYFKKDDTGVTIEGYFIAEGTLSVWILSVSARIYLAVRNQNSVVEGICTVTYTVKIGFIKKSFSGSFRRKLAGAESSPNPNTQNIFASMVRSEKAALGEQRAKFNTGSPTADRYYQTLTEVIEEDQYQVLTGKEWAAFYNNFFN